MLTVATTQANAMRRMERRIISKRGAIFSEAARLEESPAIAETLRAQS